MNNHTEQPPPKKPTLKNPRKKKQKNAKNSSQDHSKPKTKPSHRHGEQKFDTLGLWKQLEPRHSMYLSGEVERELTKQDFSDLENKYEAKITLLQNNDPGEPFKKNVISCFKFPNDEKMREFKASEDAKQLQVPGSKTLVPGMLMNTMRGSKHNITVHCSKCKKIVCEATSIYRVYKDCIWTKKGSPVKLKDAGEKHYNLAKKTEYSEAYCSWCGKFLAHHHYFDIDSAEYKIFLMSTTWQQIIIKGDQRNHTPLNYAEKLKTRIEQAISEKNRMAPINHIASMPVTDKMDKTNRHVQGLRELFVAYAGIKIKKSAIITIQDFLVWLSQLGQFDPDVIGKWNQFQLLARKQFKYDAVQIKRTLQQECHKLQWKISKKMAVKYKNKTGDEIRTTIFQTIGYDPSAPHSDPFHYNPTHNELYSNSNSDHVFLAIDLKHANYTASYFLDPATVDKKETFDEYLSFHNLSKLFALRQFRQILFGKVEKNFGKVKPISEAQSAILDAIYYTICNTHRDSMIALQRCEKSFKFSKDELMFDLGTADMNAEEAQHLITMILKCIADRMPKLESRLHVTVFKLKSEQMDISTSEDEVKSISFFVRKDVVDEKNQSIKTVMKDFLAIVCSHYNAKSDTTE